MNWVGNYKGAEAAGLAFTKYSVLKHRKEETLQPAELSVLYNWFRKEFHNIDLFVNRLNTKSMKSHYYILGKRI